MVKTEQQPVNVTQEIHQEIIVTAIINKLDEVITVMNSFDIQVNLGNIYNAIAYVTERINFLQNEKKGYPVMMKLLANVYTKLTNTNQEIEMSSEETRLRFTNQRFEMPVPVVVYVDFESASDDKNRHKPIMLSCLGLSRIPAIQTQLQVFHAPHEDKSNLGPFINNLIRLQENVKEYLFDDLLLENTPEIERDYQ